MKFNRKRKGQSAIEYLMTYGWMLLVVAIVGGAIFMTVRQNTGQCSTEVPMNLKAPETSSQEGVYVADNGYAVADGEVQVTLTNTFDQQVTIDNVTFGSTELTAGSNTISAGGETLFSATGFTETDSCNQFTLEVDYTRGSQNRELSGTLNAQLEK